MDPRSKKAGYIGDDSIDKNFNQDEVKEKLKNVGDCPNEGASTGHQKGAED